MFYDNVCKICDEKGVTPTSILRELGFSTGNISKWKSGSVPNIDLALAFARKLGVSLDYLVDLKDDRESILSDSELEILAVFSRIPKNKQQLCIDFLKTHMEDQESSRRKHA